MTASWISRSRLLRSRHVLATALFALLVGCGGSGSGALPTPSPTLLPTASPTMSAPTPTVSATPSNTAAPTDSPTPTPTCAPTGTPYHSDDCQSCPTIREGCYASACGQCIPNPTLTPTPKGPTPSPTCAGIIFAFCPGDTCGPCCMCEATTTPTPPGKVTNTPGATPLRTPVCAGPCPDLVASQVGLFSFYGCIVSFSDWLALPRDVRVCVTNFGNAAAGSFHVSVGPPVSTVLTVNGLAAGGSSCMTFPHGSEFPRLDVFADSLNEVDESDESNNKAAYAPTGTPPTICTPTPTPPASPPTVTATATRSGGTPTSTPTITPTPTKTPSLIPAAFI
ncbi:MAG: hypothetical protein HYR72_09025 [Deltaproteobacteria bacterium]|nr:hypothetical protein [Deltaproteobacteria bacterium]MBI3388899.1 hypothetical protein [Deltaproteobacteria bacterium]